MSRSTERNLCVLGRRRLLRLASLATVAGLAGCTSGQNGDGPGDDDSAGSAYGGGDGAAQRSPTDAPETDTLAEGVGYGGGSETATHESETDPSAPESPTSTLTPTSSPTAAATDTPETVTVTLDGIAFDPIRMKVPTGATVRWVNEDSFGHDVTAAEFHDAATSWDMATSLGADDSVSHTFDEPGVYEYVCTIHGESSMCGVVLVGGATLGPSLPCESDGESY